MRVFGRLTRQYSSCSASFHPLSEESATLQHFHFRGLVPYRLGDKAQEHVVSRFLAHKKHKLMLQNPRKREALAGVAEPVKPRPTLLSFEFEPTYTGGKREKLVASHDYTRDKDVDFVQTDRGGQVTFHGPGQVVLYPLLDLLSFHKLSSKCYISTLEKTVMGVLHDRYSLDALLNENTGVWVRDQTDKSVERKICSIGVNVRRSITSHGVSINCKTDLSYVNDPRIVMCGLNDAKQTSIVAEGAEFRSIEEIAQQVAGKLAENLQMAKVDFHAVDSLDEFYEIIGY